MSYWCKYCKTELHQERKNGDWVDDTEGDCCWGDENLNNENGIHWPVEGE